MSESYRARLERKWEFLMTKMNKFFDASLSKMEQNFHRDFVEILDKF